MTLTIAAAMACGLGIFSAISCDDDDTSTARSIPSTATAPVDRPLSIIEMAATQDVSDSVLRPMTDVALNPNNAPRTRIELIAVPLTIEAPSTWGVRQSDSGSIVLAGRMASGRVEILLSKRPPMPPEFLELRLRDIQKNPTTTGPGNAVQSRTSQQGNIRIIEEIERVGPAGTDPEVTPYRWTVQYFVPAGGLDYQVYELNVTDLSESMYNADESFLRQLFESARVDPKAMAAATQPIVP